MTKSYMSLEPPSAEVTGIEGLMHFVCVGLGFCGSIVEDEARHVTDFIPQEGDVSSEQFVSWLFYAEGIDLEQEPARWQTHIAAIKSEFVRQMGSDITDARALHWAD